MEWVIEPKDFEDLSFQEGRFVFSLSNCKFKELIIKNTSEIQFEDIGIYFNTCFIEKILIEEVVTQNISIDFGNSILSGKINNGNIKSVGFNNCILRDNIFVMDVGNLHITYTEENIFVRRWLTFLRSLNVDYLSLLGSFQVLHIYRPPISRSMKRRH